MSDFSTAVTGVQRDFHSEYFWSAYFELNNLSFKTHNIFSLENRFLPAPPPREKYMIKSRCVVMYQYWCFEGWNVVYECLKCDRQCRDRWRGGVRTVPSQHCFSRLLLTRHAAAPSFFLVAFWKIHSFNHRVHLFQRRRLTHAPLVSHNFIGPKNKTRPAVTWTMLLCMYGPPFCRSQDIPGVSADIPSRSVAPVPVYACQPPAIHHPRLAGPGTLDQPAGNCSLSLITSLQL